MEKTIHVTTGFQKQKQTNKNKQKKLLKKIHLHKYMDQDSKGTHHQCPITCSRQRKMHIFSTIFADFLHIQPSQY
jgi:hypothetical protein